MIKRVFLFAGTPCVGKTTLAKRLADKLDATYINLTYYAKENGLVLEEDKQRQTLVVDDKAMKRKLEATINESPKETIIIDGHYSAAVVPKKQVTQVFVLRRNPKELRQFMQKSGFSESKQNENLSAEILDVCLVEAVKAQKGKVCELDLTGKSVDESEAEVLAIINEGKKCSSGLVDWLGMLEREGLTAEYLKE